MDRELLEPPLSPLERAITASLQRDGRIPFRALAAQLGVTETTVYRHAQQLMEAGYFHVVGVVDPLLSGYGHAVLAGVSCDPRAVHEVAANIAAIPEVRFAALVTGTFDVTCELVTSDHATVVHLLTEVLPAVPGVRALNTSWVLNNYLTTFVWDQQILPVPEVLESENSDHANGFFPGEESSQHGEAGSGPLLDSTDQEIVRLLRENGRISYAEIASLLDLTESTARRRTMRILKSGHIHVVAISNPFRLGFQDVVLIWFKVELARLPKIVEALRRQPTIRYLSRTAGSVDLVAEALFRNHAELFAFLDGPLAAIEGIREVSISVELKLIKRAHNRFD